MSVFPPPTQPSKFSDALGRSEERAGHRSPENWYDRLARQAIWAGLARLQIGQLSFQDEERRQTFPAEPVGDLRADLRVLDPRFYRKVLFGGGLGVADAYVEGWWDSADLVGLLQLAAKNAQWLASLQGSISKWVAFPSVWGHRWRRNTLQGSRRNIADHYDLSNDFFQEWLDPTMTYSAALFESESDSLETAQRAKYDRLAQSLAISASDRVLEIGTGWGGFALHLAEKYGVHVTTTTISPSQYKFAGERVRAAGLQDRITLLNQDYRQVTGLYDKLVSVEMIEAVGHEFLPEFFRCCSQLLKPSGLMALQAITIPDQRYAEYLRSIDFIRKYVFPGGCLPSHGSMLAAIQSSTDMRIVGLHDFAHHYAQTLRMWSQQFELRLNRIREIMPSPRFHRIWRYYLAYCEAGFREQLIGLSQIVLAKPEFCGQLPVVGIRSPQC
ncbi:MAG: cyclopropane-fatty-acyl-phospholipid synthase [Planctomycetota bacterium]|nr:cyclopropane-fatty-acyl-phospholipid synthase [Planctomycetota bacterium]MDA1177859.1 cyclopropane-fatty-acyl-phospholipid synthase [Planctomycetota bacterium]